MPPKKTPSKESATVDPQIGQVLEMLQTLSAQMKGLGERIGAVEKKQGGAIQGADRFEWTSNEESAKKELLRARRGMADARRKERLEGKEILNDSSFGDEIEGDARQVGATMKAAVSIKVIEGEPVVDKGYCVLHKLADARRRERLEGKEILNDSSLGDEIEGDARHFGGP